MKKSTLYALIFTALCVAAGWIWFESVGIYFLAAAAISAVAALITAIRKGRSDE
jgi:hypothetical protein|nr:MAG TPA: hypothetical protein [Caudoviricetes sp.]